MTVVIFDLDGTLIDSAPDIHAASNRVLLEEGFAPLTMAQVRSFIGKGVPHLVGQLLQASGEDPAGPRLAPMIARFAEGYETAVGLTVPYPGVVAALAALRAQGMPLGVCTNKPLAPAKAVLQHLGLLASFDAVLGGDSLPQRKPDPAPLFATLAALGGGPVVYVGDSEIDAQTAAAAGMPFALYTEGYRKTPVADLPHDVAFSDFAELPGIVARLAASAGARQA
ncbi:phosphoglycolate phosphatase [Rhodobacter ferrooxidans]|uniref:Phosphoglycolate phosphatase n=1 Tax=Rhodobacter ferrooxidans TaxID=371731 RepID=C8RX30_9RHOB|nr:phosphoglycolate phosphatase [Rhodobacter sp. SW2]EEW26555.1 phosphoglycolate phosphatase [Rhodobacter sp. SW2]